MRGNTLIIATGNGGRSEKITAAEVPGQCWLVLLVKMKK
jgi:hypothetical protein